MASTPAAFLRMRFRVRAATETTLDETSCLVKYHTFTTRLGRRLAGAYFFGVRRLLLVGVALALLACNPPDANPGVPQVASLSQDDAETLILRADDVRRLAFEGSETARLPDVFAAAALQRLQAQSRSLGLRGMREQERSPSRELVFWDPAPHEAVLQVVAEQRLVTADQPNPAWSASVRQWWVRLQSIAGAWKVVDQQDLAPDRWR